jgi:hypothetical protein
MLRADTRKQYIKDIVKSVHKLMNDGFIHHVEESDAKYMMYFDAEVNSMTDYELIDNRKAFCDG